jgi:CBS-domain-containing membrane protein
VVAASASVGVSIGLMYFSRCIHPPGGATALAAVIGGEKIHALGYLYLVEPVLLNTLTLLIIAIAFNRPFEWRRYPAYTPAKQQALVSGGVYEPVKHEDFVFALSQIDTFVDINEEDLLKIYALATKPQQEPGSDQSPSGRS